MSVGVDDYLVESNPIPRGATVSDAVFARLVDEILTGRLGPEQPVPSERELALAWQVNRHAVREALKRVQQAGLVRISHGGKTRVLDWRSHAGLDVLSALAAAGVVPPRRLLVDVAVMRRTVAADAARLCALNAAAEQRAAIAEAADGYPVSGMLAELGDADLAFWTAVVDGSGNLAYRLALNTLVRAIDDVGIGVVHRLGAAEFTDRAAHLDLAAAITAGAAEPAQRIADELTGRLVTACHAIPDEQE